MLCASCYLQGFCRRLQIQIVIDDEMANPEWVRSLKAYGRSLAIGPDSWLGKLTDFYCDYPGIILSADGEEIELDVVGTFEGVNREWFREFFIACAPESKPRIRREAWERVRCMATVLKARDPVGASLWGRVVANDDKPVLLPYSSRDELLCPFRNSGKNGALIGWDVIRHRVQYRTKKKRE